MPLENLRIAQAEWAARSLAGRLRLLRKSRYRLASMSAQLVDAISPELVRTKADSYAAEVLPLLAACKFLEKEAVSILKPRRLGRKGRPFWLPGVDTTITRVPFGVVLIIAPANYPLLLAGVQTLQALAAGNAVIWKPGRDSLSVARIFAAALGQSGIPDNLLYITGESVQDTKQAIAERPDKIVFTGSAEAGSKVLHMASDSAIPVVAELSGCDAVVVLPSANVTRVLDAITFGMRLNGSATCMAPRRLILVGDSRQDLLVELGKRFAEMDGIPVTQSTRQMLFGLIDEAKKEGANVRGDLQATLLKPILIEDGHPAMRIVQSDIFAPVLTTLQAHDADEVVAMDQLCPFGLAVSIFGDEKMARTLGDRLEVGTVIINDLILPTADPRVCFGGRRGSGFGVTRGREGLLEMTAAKITAVNRSKQTKHYEPTDERHKALFAALITMGHSRTFRDKVRGLKTLAAAAKSLKGSPTISREKK